MVSRDRHAIQRRWPRIAADFVDEALIHAIFAIVYLHIEKFVRRSLVGKNDAEVRIPHVTG
jgi:hypothetical protein